MIVPLKKGRAMQAIPLRQVGSLFLAVTVFSLLLAQPLWAAEETFAPQGVQEESFFASLKRDLDEWLGRKKPADKAKEEAPKPAEPKPQEPVAKQSGGRKAINTFKRGMNKISDNVSESVERDKKTLKKKFDKLTEKK